MSETKPPDPKPVVTVEVYFTHRGERWFSYEFKLDHFAKPMVVYGATQQEAEDRLHENLKFLHGRLGYMIKMMETPSVTPGT